MGRKSRIKQELRLTPVIIQMNIPEELLVDMLFHIASDGKEYHAIIDFGNIASEHMVQLKIPVTEIMREKINKKESEGMSFGGLNKYVLVTPLEFVPKNAQP